MVLSLNRSLNLSVQRSVSTAVRQWSVASQQRARRNAMVATTVLIRRRIELDEVHEFLALRRGESWGQQPAATLEAPIAQPG